MKKTVSVLLAVSLIFMCAVFCHAQDFSCTLVPSATQVNAGEIINVDITVSEGLSGIDLTVSYDTDKFEYIGGEETNLMFLIPNSQDTSAGEIRVAAVTYEATGAGVLYTLKFRVLASDGVIGTHVNEAIDNDDINVAEKIKDSSVQIKASGSYEPSGENQPDATVPGTDTENRQNGETKPESSQNADITESEKSSESASQQGEKAITDINGNVTGNSENRKDADSKTGLATAIALGVIALAGVTAIILYKLKSKSRAAEKKSDKNQSKNK